jgi:hypothetical protein
MSLMDESYFLLVKSCYIDGVRSIFFLAKSAFLPVQSTLLPDQTAICFAVAEQPLDAVTMARQTPKSMTTTCER